MVEDVSPQSTLTTLTAHNLLDDAAFAQTSDGYTPSVAGTDFAGACVGVGVEAIPDFFPGTVTTRLEGALASSEAVYSFDKDCAPREISYRADMGDVDAGGDASSVDGVPDGASRRRSHGRYRTYRC